MKKLIDNIYTLSNEDLIKLTNELRQTVVPDDAIIRQVIKDTEVDTIAPMLAFVAVGQNLAFVLADRLILLGEKIEFLERRIDRRDRHASDL